MKVKVSFEEINTKTEEAMKEYIKNTIDIFMDTIEIIEEDYCDCCWNKYNKEKEE